MDHEHETVLRPFRRQADRKRLIEPMSLPELEHILDNEIEAIGGKKGLRAALKAMTEDGTLIKKTGYHFRYDDNLKWFGSRSDIVYFWPNAQVRDHLYLDVLEERNTALTVGITDIESAKEALRKQLAYEWPMRVRRADRAELEREWVEIFMAAVLRAITTEEPTP